MNQDTIKMNPRGHVKLELYNEHGVFNTIEKKNLIVLDANKIVANVLADPSKTIRLSETVNSTTEDVTADNGYYYIKLPVQTEQLEEVSIALSSGGQTTVDIPDATDITEILNAEIDDGSTITILTMNTDIFISDAKQGVVSFASAQTGTFTIKYRRIVDATRKIIEGTETVIIGGTTWTRANEPIDANQQYAIDYKTGEIYFESPKTTAPSITFDYEASYTLGFMGIGDKPNDHPDGQPVSFPESKKFLQSMENEFENARQPIHFPATLEQGKPEIDVLLAKQIDTIGKTDIVTISDADASGTLETVELQYSLDVSTPSLGADETRPILTISKVECTGPSDSPNVGNVYTVGSIADGADVEILNRTTGEIQFNASASIQDTDEITFTYELRQNTNHLRYQLNASPAVELLSVKFEDNNGVVTDFIIGEYEDGTSTHGLELGVNGQVQIINVNAGVIEFAESAESILKNTPGTLTVEYKVNSGTVVKFTSDFPKGVPGPEIVQASDYINNSPSGALTYDISPAIAEDPNNPGTYLVDEVIIDGDSSTTDNTITWNVLNNGSQIELTGSHAAPMSNITIKYKRVKTTHNIYQVAMFDHKNKDLGKMFNISGIGPVTKDKNTGMRITWSITF